LIQREAVIPYTFPRELSVIRISLDDLGRFAHPLSAQAGAPIVPSWPRGGRTRDHTPFVTHLLTGTTA
jgi:hypothetical protein